MKQLRLILFMSTGLTSSLVASEGSFGRAIAIFAARNSASADDAKPAEIREQKKAEDDEWTVDDSKYFEEERKAPITVVTVPKNTLEELEQARKKLQEQLRMAQERGDKKKRNLTKKELDEIQEEIEKLKDKLTPLESKIATLSALQDEVALEQNRIEGLQKEIADQEQESKSENSTNKIGVLNKLIKAEEDVVVSLGRKTEKLKKVMEFLNQDTTSAITAKQMTELDVEKGNLLKQTGKIRQQIKAHRRVLLDLENPPLAEVLPVELPQPAEQNGESGTVSSEEPKAVEEHILAEDDLSQTAGGDILGTPEKMVIAKNPPPPPPAPKNVPPRKIPPSPTTPSDKAPQVEKKGMAQTPSSFMDELKKKQAARQLGTQAAAGIITSPAAKSSVDHAVKAPGENNSTANEEAIANTPPLPISAAKVASKIEDQKPAAAMLTDAKKEPASAILTPKTKPASPAGKPLPKPPVSDAAGKGSPAAKPAAKNKAAAKVGAENTPPPVADRDPEVVSAGKSPKPQPPARKESLSNSQSGSAVPAQKSGGADATNGLDFEAKRRLLAAKIDGASGGNSPAVKPAAKSKARAKTGRENTPPPVADRDPEVAQVGKSPAGANKAASAEEGINKPASNDGSISGKIIVGTLGIGALGWLGMKYKDSFKGKPITRSRKIDHDVEQKIQKDALQGVDDTDVKRNSHKFDQKADDKIQNDAWAAHNINGKQNAQAA